jgi:DNA adenine methylase
MATSKPSTPLRYPGGKSQFLPFIESLMDVNGLNGGQYFEPYAGGAGVALALLYKGLASEIHINDLDTAIYDFWMVATYHTEEFLRLVTDTEVNMDTWNQQRTILKNPEDFNQIERGFATFFLNRTNRSGILKGGVIGGKEQLGVWKLDERFNKKNLIERILKLELHKEKIHIYNEDASSIIQRCEQFLPQNSLIYLDPPYYVKGQGLYRNFYVHDDHVAIKDALTKCNYKWVVSYDDNPEIKNIYSGYRQELYSLVYSAQNKKVGSEVMIYSDNSIVPSSLVKAA